MNIIAAHRVEYLEVPRPASLWSKTGLRYERAIHRELRVNSCCTTLYNPQFRYSTASGGGHCIPDFVLTSLPFLHPREIIILECKLTYKPEAADKLLDLYVPVVRRALAGAAVCPIIIAKNLTPLAPAPSFSLEAAWNKAKEAQNLGIVRFVPVVQWLGRGGFPINARTEAQNS